MALVSFPHRRQVKRLSSMLASRLYIASYSRAQQSGTSLWSQPLHVKASGTTSEDRAATCIRAWLPAMGSPRIQLIIELHRLDDITGVPPLFADVLVNPTNEGLVGTQQSYFLRGDYLERKFQTTLPEEWNKSSQWCGMSAGDGMLYPSQCVDGLVHQKCGKDLRKYLMDDDNFPVLHTTAAGDVKRCETGDVVWSPAFCKLLHVFPAGILHAVAPFYQSDLDWKERLMRCYRIVAIKSAVLLPDRESSSVCVAIPFLGTGVRGFPLIEGATLAAAAMKETRAKFFAQQSSCSSNKCKVTLRFVTRTQDESTVSEIMQAFDQALES